MARVTTVTVNNLGSGVNDFLNTNEIPVTQSPTTARNIRLDGLSKTPRNGYTTFADELTTGTAIQGLASYRRDLAANDRLVMAYRGDLFSIDPVSATTWTSISTTLASDSRTEFANYRDWLFIFNGVDKPGRLDNITYDEPFTKPDSITLTADFLPAFGALYLNSLWVSGVPLAPNSVFISKPALTATPQDVFDFSGAISTGAAEEIKLPTRCTAVRPMTTSAVMFTVDGAFYVEGFKDLGSAIVPNLFPIGGASGAVNQSSTVAVENDIYYLTPQKEIKSVRRGFADSLSFLVESISNNIKNFLQKNLDDDQSAAFAIYDEGTKLYKLYAKSVGATFNDLRFVADLRKLDREGRPEWMIDNAMVFNAGVYFNNQPYIGNSVIGQVYIDDDGLADDDDAAIRSFWSTKDFTANNPTTEKRFKGVNIFGQITEATSITVTVLVDGAVVDEVTIDSDDVTGAEQGGIASQTIGEFAIADDNITPNPLVDFVKRIPIRKTGKRITITFETNAINQSYKISHLEYSFIALNKMFNKVSEKL